MHEKMRAGSRLHSDVQKAGRGRTLYVTHVYYTAFPSLLEYVNISIPIGADGGSHGR